MGLVRAAVGSVPSLGARPPLPPIDEDLDRRRTAVEGGPGHPQVRPIPRNDDEIAPHVIGPPDRRRDAPHAVGDGYVGTDSRASVGRPDQHTAPAARILEAGEASPVRAPSLLRHGLGGPAPHATDDNRATGTPLLFRFMPLLAAGSIERA